MENPHEQDVSAESSVEQADDATADRRALMRKLAVGAFAVPVVLAALSSTPAHASVN
ncbi:hypothetical protein [Rhizorhabdus wittichii]|nr:hypothetical protein [Rhizorhabdus wittichii]